MTRDQSQFVTIQDVAAYAGVSAMTVSRVLNASTRVAPETRQRVEAAIAELGYVPNALASGLLHGRTRTIALIVSDISNPFFSSIVRGVEDSAQQRGYTVILGNSDESVEKERQYVRALLSKRIDGLLISPAANASRATLEVLAERSKPFVLIDREIEGTQADVVIGDSVTGTRQLTEHLIRLGHRRIGIITGTFDVPTARDRHLGYLQALREHNIPEDPALVAVSSFRRGASYEGARYLVSLPPEQRPTAILASNNYIAISLIETLRQAQLRVPEDMAVVSFDDLEMAAALDPFLTVMAQPARRFGTIAAQFLFDRLEETTPQPPRRIVLEAQLIVRRSCGANMRPV